MPPLFLCKKRNQARLSPKSVARGLRAKRSKNSGCFFFVRLSPHISRWQVRRGAGRGCRHFAKKCDYINENIKAESRRSKNVKTAESFKDSSDSAESSDKTDCFTF